MKNHLKRLRSSKKTSAIICHDQRCSFQKWTAQGSRKLFAYVPSTIHADVLYVCHDHPMAGHTGFAPTWNRLVNRF